MAIAMNLKIIVEEEEFVIARSCATLSRTIRAMLDDGGAADVITLPNIGSRTFPMIMSYLEKHADVYLSDEESWNFDREFASDKDLDILKKLMIDAYYLNIEGLKRVLAPKMADKLKIISATWKYKELRDQFHTPGWKEDLVQSIMEIDWAAEDVRLRRKREQEELEEQAKRIQIQ
ncbi:hypothetical protein CASFOL_019463 [Castilleja foliolosa]|uniref:SKP1 component POZ domain-containing protein n=1 Tax=Castilleja foliolosa TaxID=1961234 RepID=A0ABD3D7H9_9LAMI